MATWTRVACGMIVVLTVSAYAFAGEPAKSDSALTPLQQAAAAGQFDQVKDLLGKGAEVGAANSDGKTALHLACEAGNKDVASLLLEKGADVKAKDAHGNTPLILAATKGSKELCQLLIDKGADVKAQAMNKYTPLHKAAWGGNAEVIKLLIAKGADFNAEDYDSRVPLHYASNKAAVDALIAAGAEVNRRWVPWSRTPLLDAAMHGFAEAAAALIAHGGDVMATNCSHFTPLHWAAWGGHTEVVKLLLANPKVDVFYVDDSGYTALHWAEYWGHKETAKVLKEKMDSMPKPAATEKK